tara:strand:+ start:1036 stop:1740 length:705 start_codon:yes stop_codon:yes gene_type:complete
MALQTSFLDQGAISVETAKILLETKSILFNAEEPFTYTSGRVGPVYIDCRRLISFPRARAALMDFAAATLCRNIGYETMDALAGGETAGIPYAALLSDRLDLPMLYVRKKPKGFGRMAQIEGHFEEGQNVVLIEDLQTDGGSKKVFIDAMRKAGAIVEHSFVLFHYGIFEQSEKNMAEMGVKLHALTTWWNVLDVASSLSYFEPQTLEAVESFLKNPVQWSIDHGGKSEEQSAS